MEFHRHFLSSLKFLFKLASHYEKLQNMSEIFHPWGETIDLWFLFMGSCRTWNLFQTCVWTIAELCLWTQIRNFIYKCLLSLTGELMEIEHLVRRFLWNRILTSKKKKKSKISSKIRGAFNNYLCGSDETLKKKKNSVCSGTHDRSETSDLAG